MHQIDLIADHIAASTRPLADPPTTSRDPRWIRVDAAPTPSGAEVSNMVAHGDRAERDRWRVMLMTALQSRSTSAYRGARSSDIGMVGEGFRVPLGVRKPLMQEPAVRRLWAMGFSVLPRSLACRERRRMTWRACGRDEVQSRFGRL